MGREVSKWLAKFNHYICEKCKAVTITKHEHDGVTPFMLGCRATPGCKGMAQSTMYRGSQDEAQVPHVVWYRAETPEELSAALAPANLRARDWLREHHAKGGCLLRETMISSQYRGAH